MHIEVLKSSLPFSREAMRSKPDLDALKWPILI